MGIFEAAMDAEKDGYDAVVIDCFDAQDDVPPELLQSLELLRTCVRPDGSTTTSHMPRRKRAV